MTDDLLVDASALLRLHAGHAADRWVEAVAEGRVATCDPVEMELLRRTGKGDRPTVKRHLSRAYSWVAVPDDAWAQATDLQQRLADHGMQPAPSVVALLVAVTATRHDLTVLHDDNDYETIHRITGLSVERVTH